MVRFFAIGLVAASAAGCGFGGSGTALNYSAAPRAAPESLPGHVHLLRGLIGEVFSLGMHELAGKIEKRGIKASVHSVAAPLYLADTIIADYRKNPDAAPIVLIGHSTGGDAIIAIAHRLKAANVPVALAVGFDPTPISARVPSNVDLFINLYQGTNLIGGASAKPDTGFRGSIVNVDLRDRREIIHITLDKSDVIHELLLQKIVALSERAVAARAGLAPAPRRDASAARGRSKRVPPEPVYVAPLTMRYVVPQQATIELWDAAIEVKVEPGETLEAIAQRVAAPGWAIAQINRLNADRPPQDGQLLLVPRHRLSVSGPPSDTASIVR